MDASNKSFDQIIKFLDDQSYKCMFQYTFEHNLNIHVNKSYKIIVMYDKNKYLDNNVTKFNELPYYIYYSSNINNIHSLYAGEIDNSNQLILVFNDYDINITNNFEPILKNDYYSNIFSSNYISRYKNKTKTLIYLGNMLISSEF